ncbi:MAG: PASTA domain-containing protein [Muribaculaceae bacterium]|jgi:hypothetical protein
MAGSKFSVRDFYRRHPFLSNLLIVAASGLILLWLVLLFLDFWTMHGATAVVPQVKQKSYAEAESILSANKLGIEISDSIYDRSLPPGTVVESWPKAGAIVKEGRQVYVTITAFSPKQVTISMPLTGNVSSRQAMSYLRGIGITDIRVVETPSEYVDLVLGARYGDTPLTVGSVIPVTSTVTLTVGCGVVETPDSLAVDSDAEFIEPDFLE